VRNLQGRLRWEHWSSPWRYWSARPAALAVTRGAETTLRVPAYKSASLSHTSLTMRVSPAVALLAAAVFTAGTLAAQTDDGTTFRWSGPVAAGRSVRLHNLNGDVRVEHAAAGSPVELVAERMVRRGDPKLVRFAVRMRGDGDVVICALWGNDMECTDNGSRGNYHSSSWGSRDETSVIIRVRVPDGVNAFARSTNGNIAVEGLTADVDASTTNGDVNIRTSGGTVNATTTNGNVTASLGASSSDQPMRFTSTNGSVTVYGPPMLSAELDMATVNGGVSTDFPITVSGLIARQSVHGRLGQGGRSIVVRTTNGDVALRRNGI
jgi:Putative adhesin